MANSMTRKPVRRVYGYGIVGKSGKPWWDEACVALRRESLLEVVANLNDDMKYDGDYPFRVVRLFYMSRGKR